MVFSKKKHYIGIVLLYCSNNMVFPWYYFGMVYFGNFYVSKMNQMGSFLDIEFVFPSKGKIEV